MTKIRRINNDYRRNIDRLFGELPYGKLINEIKDFAIFHISIEGLILSWNQGAERIFGYRKDAIIGQKSSIIFTPEDQENAVPEMELKIAAETGQSDDKRWHLRVGGSRFYANGVVTALRNENGKLLGYAKIARDDTQRIQIEEALRESEERYRILAETASDAIISIDENSIILFINQAGERIFGYQKEQLIGQPLNLLMPEYLRHVHKAGLKRYVETGKRHISWEHIEVPVQREQERVSRQKTPIVSKMIFSPRSRTNYGHRLMQFSVGRKCCRHIISAKATRVKL